VGESIVIMALGGATMSQYLFINFISWSLLFVGIIGAYKIGKQWGRIVSCVLPVAFVVIVLLILFLLLGGYMFQLFLPIAD